LRRTVFAILKLHSSPVNSMHHNLRHLTFAFIASAFFVGCATSYQPLGLNGGYEETRLDENVFRIHFKANRYTGMERTQDFALLRGAELVVQCGCNYFAVLKSDTTTADSTHTRSSTDEKRRTRRSDGSYSSSTSMTNDVYTISTLHATITVACFKEIPRGWAAILDAAVVARSIKEKYGIK
jgi:hypothetical protein